MVNKLSLTLLNRMLNIELEQFLVNTEGSYGTLSKQARIQECFQSIITHITTRHNSIFIIQNSDKNLSINIRNIEEDNDHINTYLITLSESCETYSVDEVISIEKPILRAIKQFDKSKL